MTDSALLSAADPIAVVIGAASLLERRSGVGRMTLEIVESLQGRPELSCLQLMIAGKLLPTAAMLDRLKAGGEGMPVHAATRRHLVLRAKLLIAGVPGVQGARQLRDGWRARQVLAAVRAAGGGQAVYHEPNMITEPFDGPVVTTMNDLSWHHHPEYHPAERLQWIDRNLRRTLAVATRFVAISRFTATAMGRELGIPAEKIDVVPLAVGPQFRPVDQAEAAPTLARLGLQDHGYVLSVSTLEPRKNFDRLLAAYLALPTALLERTPLVIVGGSGWGSALASPAAERARRHGQLRLLGHVPDADLTALYARAALFVYVSIYEGFGLPLLEAMATGAPVLASSTTAVAETAGSAADLVDPLDVGAITERMRHLLDDDAHADRLRSRGLAHAAEFTWDRTATGLIASWRRALQQS